MNWRYVVSAVSFGWGSIAVLAAIVWLMGRVDWFDYDEDDDSVEFPPLPSHVALFGRERA